MSLNIETATSKMRKIVDELSFPRLVGSKDEEKAVQYIQDIFSDIGVNLEKSPFQATKFWSSTFIQTGIFFLTFITSMLIFFTFTSPKWNLLLILFVFIAIRIVIKFLKRTDLMLIKPIYNSNNLRGSIAPTSPKKGYIILMAHHDSKSQKLTTYQRSFCITIAFFGLLISYFFATVIAIIDLTSSSPSRILQYIILIFGLLQIVIGLPIIFNNIENQSPGALDNASGVAAVHSLANYFKSHPLKNREIQIIITGAEETTTFGSRSIVDSVVKEISGMDASVLNFDMIGMKGCEVEYMAQMGFPKRKPVSPFLNSLVDNAAKELNIVANGFWLPIGAMTDRYIFKTKGIDGCDFINPKAASITHTVNDTPNNFDPTVGIKFIQIAEQVISQLDKN
jgi:peptidase M28-like protein